MLKRFIPFIVTFVIGLAVASIFVSIVPSFKIKKCGEGRNERAEKNTLRQKNFILNSENESLRIENERLKVEKAFELNEAPNVEMPVPPVPPVAPRRAN